MNVGQHSGAQEEVLKFHLRKDHPNIIKPQKSLTKAKEMGGDPSQ